MPGSNRKCPQGEVKKTMAKVYANLINKGIKTLEQVPESIRADVAALLEE